jgi:hypothetical protein
MQLLVLVFLQRSLLLVFCLALTSCQSHKADSGPLIEFTHIGELGARTSDRDGDR